ncbi:hypothetical protein [Nocardia sp. NPDC003963]
MALNEAARPCVVLAARPLYGRADARFVISRVAALLMNNPSGSRLEQHLHDAGLDATRCVTSTETVGDRNIMLIEYDSTVPRDPADIARRTARAIDETGRSDFGAAELRRAKDSALGLLELSVSGMSEYVDAVCGFLAGFGSVHVLDEFRNAIESARADEVTAVIRELYVGSAFHIAHTEMENE